MAKKPVLGRGLDMIFSDNTPTPSQDSVVKLRLSQVEPKSDQPRQHFDPEALSQLADSIAANGVLQPILVREEENGLYQIIAGERRWRASKLAGLTEIPALILEADDLRTAQLALIENLQREDLNPYEEAQAYQTLLTQLQRTLPAAFGSAGVHCDNAPGGKTFGRPLPGAAGTEGQNRDRSPGPADHSPQLVRAGNRSGSKGPKQAAGPYPEG